MKLNDFLNKYKLKVNDIHQIEKAFIHSSYVNENQSQKLASNERLEYIGDAVLQLYTANFLYHQPETISEGNMTLLRSQLVNEKALSNFSRQLDLGQFLKMGIGEIKNKGNERDSILADLFEAFIGALYLDSGLDNVDTLCQLTINRHYFTLDKTFLMDYKTRLQELVQGDRRKTVTYHEISRSGPSNQPLFESAVKLDDLILGTGIGRTKKESQQQAAKDALEKMVK